MKYFYGGGFEYIIPLGGTLQRLDDVTYSFWFVKSFDDEHLNLEMPPLFIKVFYSEDYRVMARWQFTRMRKVRDYPIGRATHDLYVVPPLLRTGRLRMTALRGVEMSSRILCSCFVFLDAGMPLVRVDVGKGNHMFDIESGGKRSRYVDVIWRPGTLYDIVGHARRAIAS